MTIKATKRENVSLVLAGSVLLPPAGQTRKNTQSYKFKFISGSNPGDNPDRSRQTVNAPLHFLATFQLVQDKQKSHVVGMIFKITLDCTVFLINTYWLNWSICCTYIQLPPKRGSSGEQMRISCRVLESESNPDLGPFHGASLWYTQPPSAACWNSPSSEPSSVVLVKTMRSCSLVVWPCQNSIRKGLTM